MWGLVASIQQTLDDAAGLSHPDASPAILNGDFQLAQNESAALPDNVTRFADADEESPSLTTHIPSEHGGVIDEISTSLALSPTKIDEGVTIADGEEDTTRPRGGSLNESSATPPPPPPPPPPVAAAAAVDTQHEHIVVSNLKQTIATLYHTQQQASVVNSTSSSSTQVQTLLREGEELSRQLGVERERLKHSLADRKALEAKVSELAQQRGEYNKKEAEWNEERARLSATETTLRQQVAELEMIILQESSKLVATSEALKNKEEALLAIQDTLFESRTAHHDELATTRSEYQLEVGRLQDELRNVKHALRQATVESDSQVGALQRELSAALQRAFAAENRLLDNQCQASASLQELSAHLEASGHTIAQLEQHLRAKQLEACSLQDQLKAEHVRCGELEAEYVRKLQTANNEKVRLSQELKQSHQSCDRLQMRLDEMVRQNDGLRIEVQQAKNTPQRLGVLGQTDSMAAQQQPDQIDSSRDVLPPTDTVSTTSLDLLAVASVSTATGGTSTKMLGGNTSHRMEREVARLTREVRRLKLVEQEHEESVRQREQFLSQHDILLQMYGQLQEELDDAKSDSAAMKVAYQDQLRTLGEEVQRLTDALAVSGLREQLSQRVP